MKRNFYGLLLLLAILVNANAQEHLMFSGTQPYYGDGLYYLSKDGATVTRATVFQSENAIGYDPEYFIQTRDGEIVGVNSRGGIYDPEYEDDGYGTLYKVTARGVVAIQQFGYAEAANTFLAEGLVDGKLYGAGWEAIGSQIWIGDKQQGLRGYSITKYGFSARELLAADNGGIYATASIGGTNSQGYLYRFAGTGIEAIYNFSKPTGHFPVGKLMQGKDGYLYGVTKRGGTHDLGVIYKIKPDGTDYRVIYNFIQSDGQYPNRGLVQDAQTNIYGTTSLGGAYKKGVIFRVRPDGSSYTRLFDFPAETDGTYRIYEPLVIDRENTLFGMRYQNAFDIFRIQADGTDFRIILRGDEPIHSIRLVRSLKPLYKVQDPASGKKEVTTSYVFQTDHVPGTSSYTLEFSRSSTFATVEIAVNSYTNKFKVNGLRPGTTYYARLKTSLWPLPGPVTSFTTTSSLLYSAVTTPADGSSTASAAMLKVTVKAVTGAKRYRVELNTSPFFDGPSIFASSAYDNQRTFPVSGASPQVEYFARVTTDLNNGHGKITSFITAPAEEATTASAATDRQEISVWPNPSVDNFQVSGADEQRELAIEVVDPSGTVIYRSDFRGSHAFGDELPRGMYLVRIYDGLQTTQRRLVKK